MRQPAGPVVETRARGEGEIEWKQPSIFASRRGDWIKPLRQCLLDCRNADTQHGEEEEEEEEEEGLFKADAVNEEGGARQGN